MNFLSAQFDILIAYATASWTSSAPRCGLESIIRCMSLQAPRVAQTAIMSAVFFTLFEVSTALHDRYLLESTASCVKGITQRAC